MARSNQPDRNLRNEVQSQIDDLSEDQGLDYDTDISAEGGTQIGEQTGRRVQLTKTVDPEILGGLVVRVGNSILDASIRNRLENLRKNVAKAA